MLGFVLAGTETLDAWRFALLLLAVACAVVSILYITASKHRLLYGVYAAAIIAVLPFIVRTLLGGGYDVPSNIQPTLAVWAGMTLLIEFAPREHKAVVAEGES